MKNDLFLNADSFNGRLNMTSFSNVEKSLTLDDLKKEVGKGDVILSKSQIDSFIKDVYETTGGEIIKGGFNDTVKVKELLEKAKSDLAALKPFKVDNKGTIETVYILKKAKDSDELQKGQVSEALGYYGSGGITFKKKGSDIKAAVKNIAWKLEERLAELQVEIVETLKNTPNVPSEEFRGWGISEGVICPYKKFDYGLCWPEEYNHGLVGEKMVSSDDEECGVHRKYNNLVEEWMDVNSEIRLIKIYQENLDDSDKVELTARQMLSLGF